MKVLFVVFVLFSCHVDKFVSLRGQLSLRHNSQLSFLRIRNMMNSLAMINRTMAINQAAAETNQAAEINQAVAETNQAVEINQTMAKMIRQQTTMEVMMKQTTVMQTKPKQLSISH